METLTTGEVVAVEEELMIPVEAVMEVSAAAEEEDRSIMVVVLVEDLL